ncbi:MAG: hypothetical protein WAT79_13220, partial [Saprospiraceae bacterium]
MKKHTLFYIFIVVFLSPYQLSASISNDTITSKFDTVFCIQNGDSVFFESQLDTSDYDLLWIRKNSSDTLSTSNTLIVSTNDTIIRKSIPRDTISIFFIDTISISIHVLPKIDLVIPAIECFNEMPLQIVSNSLFDLSITMENISFYDTMNQELTNIVYDTMANNYFVSVNNGDTILVKLTYTTLMCPDIDTVFSIGTKFLPEIDFVSDNVCFGDSTAINNDSDFKEQLSIVNVSIEGISPDFSEKGNFKCYLDTNGDTRNMFVSINQAGCIA